METHVLSARAGEFYTTTGLENYIYGWAPEDRAKLSSWILEQNLEGTTPTLNPQNVAAAKERRSLSLIQKVERFLRMLLHDGYRGGDNLPWSYSTDTPTAVTARNRTMLWMEAASEREFYGFLSVLVNLGALKQESGNLYLGRWGIERLDSLQVGANQESRRAFVAMWFDDSMAEAYEYGVKPAVERAGFEAIRIDRKEHANKIDDEIILEIRQARFVVADFTSGSVTAHEG